MNKTAELSRRRFLRLSAVTAGSAMLAARSAGSLAEVSRGQSIAAAAQTTVEYKEAPVLAQRVQAGELPPVAERLPKNPYVVPHEWLTPGNYGGIMRTSNSWTGDGVGAVIRQFMYGHSWLRWLKDGLEIGPGQVESWEANADLSEWTLHFREGLKWSDGQPWTTADIMYWWDDLVLNAEHAEVAPEELKSGKGTAAKITALDDLTVVITFDSPAPLTAERLAMWVDRGGGPHMFAPKHYMSQFHPKYNTQITKQNWMEDHDLRFQFWTNPDNPVMTGWRLTAYKEGVNSTWERNPYYWCVDKEGNQLPYIDGVSVNGVQDPEVAKLRIYEGNVDFTAHFSPLQLSDISTARRAQEESQTEVRLWDSGSGTGSIFYFNYDYAEPKMRELIRNKTFRRALSHAFNRDQVQQVVYFGTGEKTTGTMSPKSREYNITDEGAQMHAAWRDSYIAYDPERATSLLEEIGVVDQNGDGKREMPDGSQLQVLIQYPADVVGEHLIKNQLLAKDWQAIGLDAVLAPIPGESMQEQWEIGKLMSRTNWEWADGPSLLVYPAPMVPVEPSRWAPMHGRFYQLKGTPDAEKGMHEDPYKRQPPRVEPEPESPIARLQTLLDQAKVEPDEVKRTALIWEITKVHIEEGPFYMGSVANQPAIVLVKAGLMNVPTKEQLDQYAQGGFAYPWIHPTPAVYDPETFYWDDPAAHS